jgi:putative transposase
MARMARLVIPGIPHHVTQRGNGRVPTFFSDADYALYRDLLSEHCAAAGVEVWAWVLMPDHVHLILTPSDEDGLRAALSRAHRRYAGHIHAREKRTGHFWQGRFGCVAMDEAHLAAAVCYVALKPARAGLALVERSRSPGSGGGRRDHGDRAGDRALPRPGGADRGGGGRSDERAVAPGRADRPAGRRRGVHRGLERQTGRLLAPAPPGPKPKERRNGRLASCHEGSFKMQ